MPDEIELRLTKDGLQVGSDDIKNIQSLTFVVNEPMKSLADKTYDIVWSKVTTIAALKLLLQHAGITQIILPETTNVSSLKFLVPKPEPKV